MDTAFFIARKLRHKSSGHSNNGKHPSMGTSVVGIALSIAIMLLTIAVIGGFRNAISQKIEGFNSQITVTSTSNGVYNDAIMGKDSRLEEIIKSVAPEASISSALFLPGMLKNNTDFEAVTFRSYDENEKWDFVKENIIDGSFPFDVNNDEIDNSIIISKITANRLNLSIGDKINTCFFINEKIRLRNYVVAAIYDSGFADFDRIVAYSSPQSIRNLRGMENDEMSSLEISGIERDNIEETARELRTKISEAYNSGNIENNYIVSPITESAGQYFAWLDLLDTNVLVIIILMASISVFTLISSLFILILDRVNMIGTLKSLGASDSLIRKVFILLASRIFLRGLIFGNIAGLGLIWLQSTTKFIHLNPEAYYVSYVPVDISFFTIVLLNIVAIFVCVLVMILPSQIISRMKPSKIIKFE